jgi:hypothetical protein
MAPTHFAEHRVEGKRVVRIERMRLISRRRWWPLHLQAWPAENAFVCNVGRVASGEQKER